MNRKFPMYCWRCGKCHCIPWPGYCPYSNPPYQPPVPHDPFSDINNETQARDLANTTAWIMAGIAAFGGPPGWIAGAVCIGGAYLFDYIDRSEEGLYDPPTSPTGGTMY